MIEAVISIGGHKVVIERFGVNDYAAYFEQGDWSIRGTLGRVLEEIVDTYGYCISDIREEESF